MTGFDRWGAAEQVGEVPMPNPRWKPLEELTPFGRLLQEWMWAQKPPLTISDLAARTGIHRQTIWQWLQKGTLPNIDSLPPLSAGTGLPIEELAEAAGLHLADGAIGADPWRRLLQAVQRNTQLPADARRELTACIEGMRERYEVVEAGSPEG